MPTFKIPKESIEGREAIPAGVYELRLDGFKPKLSKNGDSINLNPILKVNGQTGDDGREPIIFYNMNSSFGPGMTDLVHAAGLEMVLTDDGSYTIPGGFPGGEQSDPSTWVYSGPLLGKVLKTEVEAVPNQQDGKLRNQVKRFFCTVQNCTVKHRENLNS